MRNEFQLDCIYDISGTVHARPENHLIFVEWNEGHKVDRWVLWEIEGRRRKDGEWQGAVAFGIAYYESDFPAWATAAADILFAVLESAICYPDM